MPDIVNPVSWLNDWIFDIVKGFVLACLEVMEVFYRKTIDNLGDIVGQSPTEFMPTLIDKMREVSELIAVPIGGMILTYIFCYELYQWAIEKNRNGEYDTGSLMFMIIKVTCGILLITNAFDIALAFADLDKWVLNRIPYSMMDIPNSINENIMSSLNDGDIGEVLAMAAFTLMGGIIAMFLSGIVILVAWSRLIILIIYIAVAPIPMATLMNHDSWTGSIGQNYIKNLLALIIQGFLIIICVLIFSELLVTVSNMIQSESNIFYSFSLYLISLGILTLTIVKTHGIAKSIMGAS